MRDEDDSCLMIMFTSSCAPSYGASLKHACTNCGAAHPQNTDLKVRAVSHSSGCSLRGVCRPSFQREAKAVGGSDPVAVRSRAEEKM